jgi:hypothetical protein
MTQKSNKYLPFIDSSCYGQTPDFASDDQRRFFTSTLLLADSWTGTSEKVVFQPSFVLDPSLSEREDRRDLSLF